MKKTMMFIGFVILCACCTGAGYIFGGSNLGYSGYPEFSKSTPYQPFDREKYGASTYQNDVESYVRSVKEYVQNAENDKARINNAIEEAIQKANNVVDDYNNWARGW